MSILVTLEQIAQLAPNARSGYRDAFANGNPVLDEFEINETPNRVAYFMGQILHESAGFSILYENLNYSADRLPKVWPTRFQPQGPLDPAAYAHNAERFANEVYAGRMGNTAPGDGYKFRGRGLIQTTGKDGYSNATQIVRRNRPDAPDFTADPDAVLSSQWCLRVAAAEWFASGCNDLADQGKIVAITRKINGGLIGLAERKEWTRRTSFVWH